MPSSGKNSTPTTNRCSVNILLPCIPANQQAKPLISRMSSTLHGLYSQVMITSCCKSLLLTLTPSVHVAALMTFWHHALEQGPYGSRTTTIKRTTRCLKLLSTSSTPSQCRTQNMCWYMQGALLSFLMPCWASLGPGTKLTPLPHTTTKLQLRCLCHRSCGAHPS